MSARVLSRIKVGASVDIPANALHKYGQPSRIIYGVNAFEKHIKSLTRDAGMQSVLILCDKVTKASKQLRFLEFQLMQSNVASFSFSLPGACATIPRIAEAAAFARRAGVDGIIGFGGGSVMDFARATAFQVENMDLDIESLNSKGNGHHRQALKHILIPSASGSGAEISQLSLILDESEETKRNFLPEIPIVSEAVIIDPSFTISLPREQTYCGGLAALGQCIEAYTLSVEEPDEEECALAGISNAVKALTDRDQSLDDLKFRERLSIASMMAGLTANIQGPGAALGLAISVNGISDIAHVQIATIVLPFVLAHYCSVAHENVGNDKFDLLRTRLQYVCSILSAKSFIKGETMTKYLQQIASRHGLPDAASLDLSDIDLAGIADRAIQFLDNHRKTQLVELSDLTEILDNVFKSTC